ncbi:MAG: ABC transporter permease [Bacteroidetes bacterium]|nr:ABC transporter permease [Bacteroidota bacterium]
MLKSFLQLTWRNLKKDRQFTILNLLGLSVGVTCTLLIGLWVSDELNMDKYNEKDARLYQVLRISKSASGVNVGTYTPGILAPALKKELPEVEKAAMVFPASWFNSKATVVFGDKHLKAAGQYVSADYFDIFTCPILAGSRDQLFADKHAVAISDQMAEKLFGSTSDVIGKSIQWEQNEFSGDYVIRAVFRHNPDNATEQFDFTFNYDIALEKRDGLKEWGNSDPHTFVLVREGTDLRQLNAKMHDFLERQVKHEQPVLSLVKFSDRYLHDHYENGVQTGGRIVYVRLFSIVAIFILVIACINFMNLSTAKAAHRAKEVGIKKVVGAPRHILVLQYLGESVLLSFMALGLSLILLQLLLPVFNEITGKQLHIMVNAGTVASVLGITLLTGILAGSYPAFHLSGFRPVTVLKGKVPSSWSELWTRKGLVVFQFTLSVVLIASVLIIYQQINYIQTRNLGYDRDHVLYFEYPSANDSVSRQSAVSFLHEAEKIPGAAAVSTYYHTLTGRHGGIGGLDWPGRPPGGDQMSFANLEVGYNFLQAIGIRLKEGRYFSPNEHARGEIIFNETAIKAMGLKDPVGKTIRFWGQDKQIVGIASDFNFESLYQNIKPCFFQAYAFAGNVAVRVRKGSETATIAALKDLYNRFNPGLAFEYRFLEQDYNALYASEQRVGVLSKYFAGLAIFISCLGLFGLAAFTAQKRKKELGIRKVVGASIFQLTFLLSREFLALVLLSILIAFPLVYLGMHRWLDAFAYRTTIKADVFVLTAFAALVITLLTIGYQSLRAAARNPVESLRTE